jgi:hypothetical protein
MSVIGDIDLEGKELALCAQPSRRNDSGIWRILIAKKIGYLIKVIVSPFNSVVGFTEIFFTRREWAPSRGRICDEIHVLVQKAVEVLWECLVLPEVQIFIRRVSILRVDLDHVCDQISDVSICDPTELEMPGLIVLVKTVSKKLTEREYGDAWAHSPC